jgi:hypothetical protein
MVLLLGGFDDFEGSEDLEEEGEEELVKGTKEWEPTRLSLLRL